MALELPLAATCSSAESGGTNAPSLAAHNRGRKMNSAPKPSWHKTLPFSTTIQTSVTLKLQWRSGAFVGWGGTKCTTTEKDTTETAKRSQK